MGVIQDQMGVIQDHTGVIQDHMVYFQIIIMCGI